MPKKGIKKQIAYEILLFLVKHEGKFRFNYNDLAWAWKRYGKPIKFTTLERYIREFARQGLLRRIGKSDFEWIGD